MANLKDTETGSVPVPDPTVLTTAALIREIESLRERTTHDNTMLRELIEARLNAGDKAVELLRSTTDKTPAAITNAVAQLQTLHDEKFHSIEALVDTRFDSIDTQFSERDKRTEQLSLADKTAIAAALQAQKEAAGAQNDSNATANTKMETNFAKLIDQQQALLMEVRRNTDAQINDLKSRLDKGEGKTSVSDPAVANGIKQLSDVVTDLAKSRDTSAGHAMGTASLIGYIFGFGSFVGVIFAIINFVVTHAK